MEGKSVVDLAKELLDGAAAEAFDSTGGDRYRSGQPLASESAQPVAESQPPAEAPPAEPAKEEPTSPERLIAGKWKTDAEAERGYHEIVQHAKRLQDRVMELETKLAPPPATPPDPLTALEEVTGVPRTLQEQAMRAVAERTLQEVFGPAIARVQADAEVVKEIPEYEKELPQLNAWLEEHPEVKADMQAAEAQGSYALAKKYAWLNYDRARNVTKETILKEEAKATKEKKEEARVDAAVLKPSQTEARATTEEKGLSDERFAHLVELAKSGHPSPLWRETIGKNLSKDVFPDE